jgi:hypothetical protein
MNKSNVPQLERSQQARSPSLPLFPAKWKAQLVDLGLACLSLGEWAIVAAISRSNNKGGMRHA